MKTAIRTRAGALLLALVLAVGLMPLNALSVESCQNGAHTPGDTLYPANWNSTTGGYSDDYYLCTVCGTACNEYGAAMVFVGAENGCSGGRKCHLPGATAYNGTDQDGQQVTYYRCTACQKPVDADGTVVVLSGSSGSNTCPSGAHTPGNTLYPANWNSTTGGYGYDYYLCTVCGAACNEYGVTEMFVGPGNGCSGGLKCHLPGTTEYPANYTPCNGGFQTPYYYCTACGWAVDASGTLIDWVNGTGAHTLGEMHEADYTPCNGGVKENFWVCEICGQPIDANGNVLQSYNPTANHVAGGEMHEANYAPCAGGFKENFWECETCGQPIDENGNLLQYFEPTENHVLGEKQEPNYTVCEGGFQTEWYECAVCYSCIDENGNLIAPLPGTGAHVPGGEMYEADYTPCNGGFRENFWECEDCGRPVDANGQPVEYEEGTGAHRLSEIVAEEPTYEEEGNLAYWHCELCETNFWDAQGTSVIEDMAEVVLPRLEKPEDKPEVAPNVEPEKPAGTLETVVSGGLAAVPQSVAGLYSTTDAVHEALLNAALAANAQLDPQRVASVLLDVTLQLRNADGTLTAVSPQNFPTEGVEVLLPYPEGTDQSDLFVVTHLITSGSRAGQMEVLPSTPEAGGIRVRFTSLSPVVIAYQANEAAEDRPADVDEPTEEAPVEEPADEPVEDEPAGEPLEEAPKTGDFTAKGAVLLPAVALLTLAAAAAYLGVCRHA